MRRSPNRVAGLWTGAAGVAFGIVAIVAGILSGQVIGPPGVLVGPFSFTVALGVAAVLGGGALVVAAIAGLRISRLANIAIGTACLLLGFAGLFLVGTDWNVLGASGGINAVLFGAATVLLAVGLGARRDRKKARLSPGRERRAPDVSS